MNAILISVVVILVIVGLLDRYSHPISTAYKKKLCALHRKARRKPKKGKK